MDFREIETWIAVDGRDVAACIRLPRSATTSTPVPGIVFVDGSGPAHRHDFGPQPAWFLEAGFATLTYDKPGCGDTAGDWRRQSIPDRAREPVAALTALRAFDEVAADAVGLWGASQGGWVVPLAIAADPDVAFAILVSAAGVSPYEQEAVSLRQRMQRAGESAEAIEAAIAAYWELIDRLRGPEPAEDIVASLSGEDDRYRYFHPELVSEPELISFFALIGDHDPLSALASMVCPTLLIWGEHDPLVPVRSSETIFREQLAAAGNNEVTTETFAHADHWIMIEASDGEAQFAPGYVETMTAWAKARAG